MIEASPAAGCPGPRERSAQGGRVGSRFGLVDDRYGVVETLETDVEAILRLGLNSDGVLSIGPACSSLSIALHRSTMTM